MIKLAVLSACFATLCMAASPSSTIRGKLRQPAGAPPILVTNEGKRIELAGDKDTTSVLQDKRLAGMDLELKGHFEKADRFVADPIYTKAMHVHKDGKSLFITYWCEVCHIRTYTPGICMCCQAETELDLREKILE